MCYLQGTEYGWWWACVLRTLTHLKKYWDVYYLYFSTGSMSLLSLTQVSFDTTFILLVMDVGFLTVCDLCFFSTAKPPSEKNYGISNIPTLNKEFRFCDITGETANMVEKLKSEHVCGWLRSIAETHRSVLVSCLLPHPPHYTRQAGHWDNLASKTHHLKDGLNRWIFYSQLFLPLPLFGSSKIYSKVRDTARWGAVTIVRKW